MRTLRTVVAGLLLLLMSVPVVQAPLHYRLLIPFAVLASVWLLLTLMIDPKHLLAARKVEVSLYLAWTAAIFSYAFFLPNGNPMALDSPGWSKLGINWSQITILYMMGVVHSSDRKLASAGLLLQVLVVGLALNALLGLPAQFSSPLAVRDFINVSQSMDVGRPSVWYYALGDLGYYCALTLALPLSLSMAARASVLSARVIWIACTGSMAVSILLSSLGTVVAAFALSLGLSLVVFGGLRKRGPLLVTTLGASILLAGYLIVDLDAVNYSRAKILTLSDLSKEADVASSRRIEKRTDHYANSWAAFCQYPVFGLGAVTEGAAGSDAYELGGHSGVFDGLGRYGLVFCIFVAFLSCKWRAAWKRIKQPGLAKAGGLEVTLLAVYTLLIFADPVLFSPKVTGTLLFLLGAQASLQSAARTRPPVGPGLAHRKLRDLGARNVAPHG